MPSPQLAILEGYNNGNDNLSPSDKYILQSPRLLKLLGAIYYYNHPEQLPAQYKKQPEQLGILPIISTIATFLAPIAGALLTSKGQAMIYSGQAKDEIAVLREKQQLANIESRQQQEQTRQYMVMGGVGLGALVVLMIMLS